MDSNEILDLLVRCILVPLIPLVGAYMVFFLQRGIKYLQEKSENEALDRYIGMVGDMLEKSVLMTTQTYVSTIKQTQGKLTPEQIAEANRLSIEAFEKSIGEDGKKVIEMLYGDYQQWIEKSIESIVAQNHVDTPKK